MATWKAPQKIIPSRWHFQGWTCSNFHLETSINFLKETWGSGWKTIQPIWTNRMTLQVCSRSQWDLFDCFDCGTVQKIGKQGLKWGVCPKNKHPSPRFVGCFWCIVVAYTTTGVVVSLVFFLFGFIFLCLSPIWEKIFHLAICHLDNFWKSLDVVFNLLKVLRSPSQLTLTFLL